VIDPRKTASGVVSALVSRHARLVSHTSVPWTSVDRKLSHPWRGH
jgi:hypothetical protein